ncbi:MAG: hypothetical protein IPH96_03070 [Saprospiraceae bacterium]|nr:hypothetical protein [Saprospiraceae bacterium]
MQFAIFPLSGSIDRSISVAKKSSSKTQLKSMACQRLNMASPNESPQV